ncbi:MAG: 50S ribosomal protein L4 [Candidatus Aenigmarchaeota archaeon]|nr:50S ribosomal protein L4 [Candidatus Aenigmarchaeota archaeon]
MKVPVYGLNGEAKGDVSLAKAFSRPVRTDVIKKAVLAEQARKRQPYGSDPLAGQRTSAKYKGRRGIRGSMMNREMARMKRITAGGYLRMRARFVPQAVKGRRAHPPKAEKNWLKKINKKERTLALVSAISGTADKELITGRGHLIDGVKHIPLVLDDRFQELKKNKEVVATLAALGLEPELGRCSETKTRAGRGKTRGRRTIRKKGPLIVISEDKGIVKAAKNIAGVDVSDIKSLEVSSLAPGTAPGRLTIWTKSAASAADKLAGG